MEQPQAADAAARQELENNRLELLGQIEDWLEKPLIVLGFVWLILLIVELIWGLTPILQIIVNVIWGVFVFDFCLRFVLAPRKLSYLRNNVLTMVSLVLPALRILRMARLFRVMRAARGVRLVGIVGSLNRGVSTMRASMRRRGFGYVMALTLIIVSVGAAGMYAFESGDEGFRSYGEALWWTAMLVTSIGSEFWPQTAEGRILCLILSIYGFAIFGYVTATLASLFVGQDAKETEDEAASARSVESLQSEIAALRADIQELLARQPDAGGA